MIQPPEQQAPDMSLLPDVQRLWLQLLEVTLCQALHMQALLRYLPHTRFG